jgi:ABC-2 type transport system permease protein
VRRYLRLFWIQLRASLLLAMQYRYDFLLDGLISSLQIIPILLPVFIVFSDRPEIAGWTFGEALLVTAWFITLDAIIDGAINPSLATVVDHIRKGTLDFVLLKPADAQFLVSTARYEPWRVTHLFAAAGVFAYAFARIGRLPSAVNVLTSLLLLFLAVSLLYSLWILTVSTAFYVVKVDNLSYLFGAIFDAARWPVSIFRGAVRFAFTFVIPLALMTTFPAEALLGRVSLQKIAFSVGGTVVFAAISRWIWMRSIQRYTSASS